LFIIRQAKGKGGGGKRGGEKGEVSRVGFFPLRLWPEEIGGGKERGANVSFLLYFHVGGRGERGEG